MCSFYCGHDSTFVSKQILKKKKNYLYIQLLMKQYFLSSMSPKSSARSSGSATSECKCCRICGTIYQKDRNCDCLPKNYPKPVAYELSFIQAEKVPETMDMEVKCIEKNATIPKTTTNNVNGCKCGGSQHNVKRSNFDCNDARKVNFNGEKKSSLQVRLVFLYKNYPSSI